MPAGTAELPLRRGRFLDFAADNGLLVKADGEHRFKHLLMRGHLADCDPARPADSLNDETGVFAAPLPRTPGQSPA
ncbi:hypothetical protein [Sphaerisporangium dianthi]|uniref:Uncharacterized protein n=1 Tax=Sphaerisporangium dianthi TaxID=1436120 RepID=A0ABV9CQJ2_9ACTN